ncbi:MAG TPA: hypothetical protein VFP22_08810 [Candidatus Limnocylindrales bacterium]|nr:hypothetical protein [Candidatus Limnocylindrales bacterium]
MDVLAAVAALCIGLTALIAVDVAANRWGTDSRQLDREDGRWAIR